MGMEGTITKRARPNYGKGMLYYGKGKSPLREKHLPDTERHVRLRERRVPLRGRTRPDCGKGRSRRRNGHVPGLSISAAGTAGSGGEHVNDGRGTPEPHRGSCRECIYMMERLWEVYRVNHIFQSSTSLSGSCGSQFQVG